VSVAAYLDLAQSYRTRGNLDRYEWEHYRISLDGDVAGLAFDPALEDSGGTNMGPPPPPPGLRRWLR
jgi:hypothetical protein